MSNSKERNTKDADEGLRIKEYLKSWEKEHEKDLVNIFIGRRTVFTLLGATVGGVMVGRTLWEWGRIYLGLPATFLVGILIFILSDYILQRFNG